MKKRALFIVFLVALLLLPCIVASAASTTYFVSGTSWLRLRQLPSSTARILASYRRDYAIISYKKYNADWAYIHFSDGHEGYVMRKYLKSSRSFTAYVTTDDTILRSGPATTFAKKDSLPRGTKLTSLTSGANWNYVKLSDGTYGYINKKYLSKKYIAPPAPSPSPAPTFEPTPTAAPFVAYNAYITSANGKPVNIRNGAGTGHAVITKLDVGTKVRVVEEINSKWSRIRFGNKVYGFVQSKFLTTSNPEPVTRPAWILADEGKKINVRNGPGSSYAVVFKLYAGTKVTALIESSTKNWVNIKYDGRMGFVQSKYITYDNPGIDGGGIDETPVPTSEYPYTAYITSKNGNDVNVRVGAGSGYALAGSLKVGTKIRVQGKTDSWFKIKTPDGKLKGYVKEKFVTRDYVAPTPTPNPDGSPSGKTMTVNTPDGQPVNMRKGPGKGYSNVCRVNNGEKVIVVGSEGQWAHVYYNKLYGYIMYEYLK